MKSNVDQIKVAMWKEIIEQSKDLVDRIDNQKRAVEELNDIEFDALYESVKWAYPTTVRMGLNLSKHDGEAWKAKVDEVRSVVEAEGVANVSWQCTGRTLHQTLSYQLEEALPEYRFEIGYEDYSCRIFKR